MISDAERREVARRLRSFVTDDSVYADVDACRVLHSIGLYYKDIDRIYFSGFDVARLADLIEPNDSAQTVAEDMFGQMRHSTEQERVAYADMLARNSVELHPIDRDALLALAEDVGEAAVMAVVMDDSKGAKMLADMLLDIARRIREAWGG